MFFAELSLVFRDGTTQGQRGAMRLPPTFEKKNTIMYINKKNFNSSS